MEPQSTSSGGFRVTMVGVVVNIALAILKFAAGIIGHSTAMVADAIHSLSDLVTDIIVYISLKISSAAPDKDHPYGHGRAETIGAAVIGLLIAFVGIGIAWEIFSRVVSGERTSPTPIAIVGALLSLIIKEVLFRYTLTAGKNLRSDSIIANAWHHRSDALSSFAALIGITGSVMGYPLMDPLAAVVVGLMISGAGAKISWEAVKNLMDTGVSPEELADIEKIIRQNPEVLHFHELKTRKVGKDTYVDLHIQVSPRISISEAHNISESVRLELRTRVDAIADALVHIDAEDDREGRLYKIDRKKLMDTIDDALSKTGPLRSSGEPVLHYLLHQISVEITVEVDGTLQTEEIKKSVENLIEKVLEHPSITEVAVKQYLGGRKIARKNAKGV